MAGVIVLLPPSEGKTPAVSGPVLDFDSLSFPQLTGARIEVLESLAEVSALPDACAQLGVGLSLHEDVARNTELTEIPCAPALETYTGVLYAALDAASLRGRARERLAQVYVSSALFGILGAEDPIPAYRLSMKTKLAAVGVLATWWKPRLASVLDEAFAGELILDCRSTEYRKSWPGPVDQVVTVSAVTEKDGKRTVVSHNAKHTRGELAGHLLRSRAALPATPEALLRAARRHYTAELTPATRRKPAELTIALPG
ncbi:YaaA family protein [Brevibacterium otitidis]|uniref:YaaA family protein n=1 Tax=Brevibacterium otitidis TaxID=53364 RepID=UPI00360EF7BD